jgi:hypothetical protein
MKPRLNEDWNRRLLDEYCWFLSVEMRGSYQSEVSLNNLETVFHDRIDLRLSSDCKLQQSTIYDMNNSLLHDVRQ